MQNAQNLDRLEEIYELLVKSAKGIDESTEINRSSELEKARALTGIASQAVNIEKTKFLLRGKLPPKRVELDENLQIEESSQKKRLE